MQVKVDMEMMECMETNFGSQGIFGFRDFALFSFASKQLKFPFGPWTHGGQKIESPQKNHASRG